jgi:hypothetical protein
MKPLGYDALVDPFVSLTLFELKAAPRLFEDEVSNGGLEIPIDDRDRG